MADATVIYTRGDANAPDIRGESMVERHHRKIQAEKEAAAHSQLRVIIPDAGPALRNLALESCEWDVDRAKNLIKRFREVKAREIKALKDELGREEEPGARANDGDQGSSGSEQSASELSDSEGSAASGASSEEERGRHKRKSHRSKSKKSRSRKDRSRDKGHKRKKSRDRSSDRKAKRHRSDKRSKEPKTAALTEQYGKYGIIKESDYESKRGDFQLWATEVKKVQLELLPKREERDLFRTYMEDFNTGTLPHKKYYDNDAYQRAKALKAAQKGGKRRHGEKTQFDDEEERRREAAQRRAEELEERRRQAYNELRYTTNKAQEMREQEMLRQQMNLAYRTGNMEEARKLQERLNPDEEPNK
uniref:Nucleic acid binding n=1 Tax=Tetraselmis sp. GSL018 TaxID=582737 RepID=A0A061QX57_9CHLO|mmetsp:Transcript_21755/g.51988  ORF Transcript_21755/g.51988 Transcript_21755/m.51988 type:complete len:362 (-) Transcript_21755:184-1269(-)